MRVHGRVTFARIARTKACASSSRRYSSTNFTASPPPDGCGTSRSPSSPISLSVRKTSRAWSSSSLLIAKPTCTRTYSPTLTSGVYAKQTSFVIPANETTPIGMSTALASMLTTLPGTPRHIVHPTRRRLVRTASQSPRCRCFRRSAATRTWPTPMPPSLGGTAPCSSTSNPAASSRATAHLRQEPVLEAAAGQGDARALRRAAPPPGFRRRARRGIARRGGGRGRREKDFLEGKRRTVPSRERPARRERR